MTPCCYKKAYYLSELRLLMSHAEQAHLDSFPAVPLGHWDTLRTRYAYCLRVLAPLRPQTLHIFYLNEDEDSFDLANQPNCVLEPLPDHISYVVNDARFANPDHSTTFDPAELRRAFARLQRTVAPGERPELQIQPMPARVRVFLSNKRQSIELTRSITYIGPK